MIEFGGWQFPSGEKHLPEWLAKVNDRKDGRLRYQGKKQDAAMRWCRQFRVACDTGGHVGLWAFYLAQKFETVQAFEPIAEHRECFKRNVPNTTVLDGSAVTDFRFEGFGDTFLHPCALGDRDGSIAMHSTPGSSGDSYISGDGDIPLKRLDDLNLATLDFWKLDCEGAEGPALRGGEQTILRCRPTVIVEQKPGRAQKFGLDERGAVAYLQSLGMALRQELSGDYILSFD